MSDPAISRRTLLRTSLGAALFSIVPRHVVAGSSAPPPSERLNIAGIGIGGRGTWVLQLVAAANNIVALCDVDDRRAADSYARWPNAARYKDYRVMLEKEKGIDAVVIATPNHVHAVMAMAAMQLGKHVFVEKPMAHTIHEVRTLTEAARRYKVATQMGNQGHASMGCRQLKTWIADGAIGRVTEVQCWTTFPSWPQGMDRPADTPPVPSELDWDQWLGPAQERPYHPAYLPGVWRGWWDFGEGALGDMGCHVMDGAFYALDLGAPVRVSAETSGVNSETAPKWSILRYEFPKRGRKPPLILTWYDGGKMPPRPEELEEGRTMGGDNGGVVYIGTKGKIMSGSYCDAMRIIPEEKMQRYKRPRMKIPTSPGHMEEWIQACKGGPAAGSNFDYAGPLTEMVLLGNIAIRAGQPIEWDPVHMKITNVPEAQRYVTREYRAGWSL